jgi:hypothetical protein
MARNSQFNQAGRWGGWLAMVAAHGGGSQAWQVAMALRDVL